MFALVDFRVEVLGPPGLGGPCVVNWGVPFCGILATASSSLHQRPYPAQKKQQKSKAKLSESYYTIRTQKA